jgi:D-alanyl-D-alanine dipeptidase
VDPAPHLNVHRPKRTGRETTATSATGGDYLDVARRDGNGGPLVMGVGFDEFDEVAGSTSPVLGVQCGKVVTVGPQLARKKVDQSPAP